MANLDLSKYGIQDVKEIIHNPSWIPYLLKSKFAISFNEIGRAHV